MILSSDNNINVRKVLGLPIHDVILVTITLIASFVFFMLSPYLHDALVETPEEKFVRLLYEEKIDEFNKERSQYYRPLELSGDFSGLNLQGVDLSYAILFGKFDGSNLSSANLEKSKIFGTMIGTNLNNARMWKAELDSVFLTNAILIDADLPQVKTTDILLRNANLTNANLFEANLSNAYLDSADLSHTELYSADLRDAYLDSANLYNATLILVNLSNAYLDSANLSNAILYSADFTNAYLDSANLSNALMSVCYDGLEYKVQNLPISKEEAIARGAIYEECPP